MGGSKPRTVKLFCPLLAKIVPFVVWGEQRLDLGSIVRTFGLDPATLKLNDHFIGRGIDLIDSSVTWNSLRSFFSARGFPTGKEKDDLDALIVDGKLIKVGIKRPHEPQDSVIGSCYVTEYEVDGGNGRPQPGDLNLVKNKKLKEIRLEGKDLHGFLGFKRKQLIEDVRLLKKLNISETHSGRGNYLPNGTTHIEFACNYMSENLKRRREDEAFLASPCKRIR